MTAATSTADIPGPRQPEAPPPTEQAPPPTEEAPQDTDTEEPGPQARYEQAMARFAAMYEEWSRAARAIQDA
jgi:hypothetical protein